MQHTHQIVYIKIQIVDQASDAPRYIASNDELGIITQSSTFRELLDNLREALAVSATHRTLSLQFYSECESAHV